MLDNIWQDAIASLGVGDSTGSPFLWTAQSGIFVRRPEQMTEEDRTLMQSVARVMLSDTSGLFTDQIERRGRRDVAVLCSLVPIAARKAESIL